MTNTALAIVFPGQGSQSVGMLSDMVDQYPEIKTIFDQASAALGYDLWQLTANGPSEELNKTEHTQPALLAASFALWKIFQAKNKDKENGLQPVMLAGHSLGEYTALVCANALQFTDAIKLVAARGKYMREAVAPGEGAMAAIVGLDDMVVATICHQALSSADEVLAPANFNSLGQVVIAGHKAPVERAVTLAKEQGAKLAMLIPVSVPSHCELMRPAAERLKELLAVTQINTPNLTVVSNVDVLPYQNAEEIRSGLVRQLYMPVRWVETIQYAINESWRQTNY